MTDKQVIIILIIMLALSFLGNYFAMQYCPEADPYSGQYVDEQNAKAPMTSLYDLVKIYE